MKKIRIPFVFEILLCAFLLIMFRISAHWQYFVYDFAGIMTRSAITDFLGIITHILCFSIVIALGLKIQKRTLVSVCFFKKTSVLVWFSLVLCAVGYVLFQFYIDILFATFSEGWTTDFAANENILPADVIDTAVIPAIAEELLIKGLIFYTLRKRFNVIVSVIIASILFSACHLSITQFISHFLFSCFTFWVYLRTGSILLPMVIHFINNLFAIIMIWEPFGEIGTFYSAIILFGGGVYILYRASKKEKNAKKELG